MLAINWSIQAILSFSDQRVTKTFSPKFEKFGSLMQMHKVVPFPRTRDKPFVRRHALGMMTGEAAAKVVELQPRIAREAS